MNRRNLRHGHGRNGRRSPEYNTWYGMRDRCTNTRRHNYASYGGRGIRVCSRWLTFENFLADMGRRPEGTSIDRIDVNRNYEPGNCRWATQHEQRVNYRPATRAKARDLLLNALMHDERVQRIIVDANNTAISHAYEEWTAYGGWSVPHL